MKHEAGEYIKKGFTLVTASRRLARHILYRHAGEQMENGKLAWETVPILPWGVWLSRLWQHYISAYDVDQTLLTPQQQLLVWQRLLAASPSASQLLNPVTTGREAMAAWSLCRQWRLPVFPDDIYLNEDARAFKTWADEYQHSCKSNSWVDEASLATILADRLEKRTIDISKKIVIVGFDEFTPQQKLLFKALKGSGHEVLTLELEDKNRQVCCQGFNDIRAEITAAANWVRGLLDSGAKGPIGIVVPNLQSLRDQIEIGMDDVLLPALLLHNPDSLERPYNFSLGRSLSGYPIIDAALTILALGRQPLMLDDIGALLRSPFIKGAHDEQCKRARLDARLRDFGEHRHSIESLLRIGGQDRDRRHQSATLLACLHEWRERFNALPGRQSAHRWAAAFTQLLTIFAWPGERTLNSVEYQTVAAWQELIGQFASLDLVSSEFDYTAALTQLRLLAAAFGFQPETAEAPVQVLGQAGAAGMQFDHLWVMGLHDKIWPAPARPNPFIPGALQRHAVLPDASAEIKLAHTELLTERLIASSPDVVLSFPLSEKEGPLRPSPLLKPYILETGTLTPESIPNYAAQIFTTGRLQCLVDDRAPEIESGKQISGGTALFKDQSACPFRAFARHRLHAKSIANVDIGLNAMERGLLIHRMMHLFWEQLGSQQRLLELDDAPLEERIGAVVDSVINAEQQRHTQTYTVRFTSLERARLKKLLRDWLQQEQLRAPFKVTACEQTHNFSVEGIEVTTRIDRIDKLDDGRQVIVDYKTGQASVRNWLDERPDDPQLPLYAVCKGTGIAALAFARIKQGETAFVGLAEEGGILPGIGTYADSRHAKRFSTWQALLSFWQQAIASLADEFRAGHAQVDPKRADSCRYCDQHAFCRIYEHRALSDG